MSQSPLAALRALSDRFQPLAAAAPGWLVRRRLALAFGTIYLFLSLFVMLHFAYSGMLGDRYSKATFEATHHGTAWKPFVYRTLVPILANAVEDMTPGSVKGAVNRSVYDTINGPSFSRINQGMPWIKSLFPTKNRVFVRVATLAIIYGFLCLYAAMMFKTAQALFPGQEAVAWFAPIFGMLAVSSFSAPMQYNYDIPVLALSAACYYTMLMRQFRHYLFFFFLACLNKETAFFLLIFFTLWFFNRLPSERFIWLWAGQCFIYLLVKIVLTFVFLHNPGVMLEDGFGRVLGSDIFTKANLYRIVSLGMLWFLLTYRWNEKPAFLKTIFWVLPFVFITYIFYGWPNEYRVYFDVMPPLLILFTHTLIAGTGISASPLFRSSRHV